jgi:hypothetical protein
MKRVHNIILFAFLAALLVTFQSGGNIEAAEKSSLKVFVNYVDVTGLVNQEFKGCTVRFDDKGNVYIDAPGYKIKKLDSGGSQDGSPSPSTTTVVTEKKKTTPVKKKYFLVTEENDGTKVWDKYSLIVNGNVVKTFKSSDGVLLEDISKNLSQGTNQIIVTASKVDKFPGSSKSYWYRVIIGEGHEEDKKIVIDKTLMQMTRLGSDVEPDSKSTTLEAK